MNENETSLQSSRTLNTICSRSSPVVGTTQHCTPQAETLWTLKFLHKRLVTPAAESKSVCLFVCLLLLSALCVSNLPHTLKSKNYPNTRSAYWDSEADSDCLSVFAMSTWVVLYWVALNFSSQDLTIGKTGYVGYDLWFLSIRNYFSHV